MSVATTARFWQKKRELARVRTQLASNRACQSDFQPFVVPR
jgi:hypothetical protein